MHAGHLLAPLVLLALSFQPLAASAQSGWPAGFQQQFPPVAPASAPRMRVEETRPARLTVGVGTRLSMFDIGGSPSADAYALGPTASVGLRLTLGRYADIDVRLAGHFSPTLNEHATRVVPVEDDWYYTRYEQKRTPDAYFEGSVDLLLRLFPSGGRVYFGPGVRAAVGVATIDVVEMWYGCGPNDRRSQPDFDNVVRFDSGEVLFQMQGVFGAGILIGPDYGLDLGLRVALGFMRGGERIGFDEMDATAAFELNLGVAL